jgi:predicted lactoylglutathione lyase
MATAIFVNLPVKNLDKHDYGRKYLCHAVDGRKVQAFTPKEICDASKSIEVLLVCLSCGSREKVDEMVR